MNDTKIMTDTLKIERAITGLTEWQKHVQTGSDIDRDIAVALEVLKARLDTDVPDMNVGDMISRQAAIEAVGATDWYSQNKNKDMVQGASSTKEAWYKAQDVYNVLKDLPSAQLSANLAEVGTDCISRQAAIDAINHELRCGAVINQCGLEMAYEVIEGLPPAEPNWIPCSERLPKKEGFYLVTLGYKHGAETNIRFFKIENGEPYWSKWGNETITAWMPKPEPYNEVTT